MVVGQQSMRRDSLKVAFTNAQSINNKMDETRAVVALLNPDIFAVTGSWANEEIGNELLGIDGFELIVRMDQNDTSRGRGGGILVYVKKEIDAMAEEVGTEFNQCAAVKIKSRGGDTNIFVVYRSPNSSHDNDNDLSNWIKEMRGRTVVIGDFNFPDIDWAVGTAGTRGCDFFEATQEAFMEQHVDESTHRSGNVLDLILCNQENMVKEVKAEGRLGKSDHDILSFDLCIATDGEKRQKLSLNFAKAKFTAMREAAQKIDW